MGAAAVRGGVIAPSAPPEVIASPIALLVGLAIGAEEENVLVRHGLVVEHRIRKTRDHLLRRRGGGRMRRVRCFPGVAIRLLPMRLLLLVLVLVL